jgi:hypothetical protein
LEEKVPCVECGKLISASLVSKRKGLCLQCSLKRNPYFLLSNSLTERVAHSPGGFAALSDVEQLYHAITLFQGEVNNGGFHQFFFNSSGAHYELIENALITFDEPQVLELLHRAKQIVFPEILVPVDTEIRRERMRDCPPSRLDELDRHFYSIPNTLSPKLKVFARERGLVSPESDNK